MGKRQRTKSRSSKPLSKRNLSAGLQLLLFFGSACILTLVFINLVLSARTFHLHGVLVTVDESTRTLALNTKRSSSLKTYTWNEDTEFRQGESKVLPKALLRGTEVVVFYRGGFFAPHTAVSVKWSAQNPN